MSTPALPVARSLRAAFLDGLACARGHDTHEGLSGGHPSRSEYHERLADTWCATTAGAHAAAGYRDPRAEAARAVGSGTAPDTTACVSPLAYAGPL